MLSGVLQLMQAAGARIVLFDVDIPNRCTYKHTLIF
jgi:hypothetical protein